MLNRLLPENSEMRHLLKRWFAEPKVPSHLSKRFIHLTDSQLEMIGESLRRNYFSQSPNG
jgi:intein-encoded DNA endonuclease-like protein